MNKCVVSFLSNKYVCYMQDTMRKYKNENIYAALRKLIVGDIFPSQLLTKYQSRI